MAIRKKTITQIAPILLALLAVVCLFFPLARNGAGAPVRPRQKDNERHERLKELLRESYDLAHQEVQENILWLQGGRYHDDELRRFRCYESLRRALQATLDITEESRKRVDYLEPLLADARKMEAICKERPLVCEVEKRCLTAVRVEIEAALLREQLR